MFDRTISRMRLAALILLALAPVALAAETLGLTTAPAGPAVAATQPVEMIDNPTYLSWKQYKAGTTVTLSGTNKMSMGGQDMMMTMEATQKLLEVTDQKVVVEVSNTVTVAGQKQDSPAQKVEITAKVEKSQANLPPMGPGVKMTVSNLKTGTDSVEVKGEKLAAVTSEFDAAGSIAGTDINSHLKVWTNSKVPGNLVKMNTTMQTPAVSAMSLEVKDYDIAK